MPLQSDDGALTCEVVRIPPGAVSAVSTLAHGVEIQIGSLPRLPASEQVLWAASASLRADDRPSPDHSGARHHPCLKPSTWAGALLFVTADRLVLCSMHGELDDGTVLGADTWLIVSVERSPSTTLTIAVPIGSVHLAGQDFSFFLHIDQLVHPETGAAGYFHPRSMRDALEGLTTPVDPPAQPDRALTRG